MNEAPARTHPRRGLTTVVFGAVAAGGFAALGWEILWQLRTTLALGISSQATALVIAATMGGMALGTVGGGLWLDRRGTVASPLAWYAALEAAIGLFGLALAFEFDMVAQIDAILFRQGWSESSLPHLVMIACVLGPPAMAMGMTIPVLGLVGRQLDASLALLYGTNTLGAAIGTLVLAFVILPLTSVSVASGVLAGVNLLVAGAIFALSRRRSDPVPSRVEMRQRSERAIGAAIGAYRYPVVFLTGFAVFAIEVVFFRAMRAAFTSTTHTFAILLAAVLIALAMGAHAARLFEGRRASVGSLLAVGGAFVLLVTPLVERMDRFTLFTLLIGEYASNFLLAVAVVGPPVALLGVAFPHLLAKATSPRDWGLLHATNTLGAIGGSLLAAWVLLPGLGIAASAWLVGGVLVASGVLLAMDDRVAQLRLGVGGLAALGLAVLGESGIGETRIFGQRGMMLDIGDDFELIDHEESHDFSVSVVDLFGYPELYIDGVGASSGLGGEEGYMAWMGHLPMMAHPDPKRALIICFGRGETANALRHEGPEHVDIVDISASVFRMAGYFPNQGVLDDPRVHTHVMDGRAWMRRTDRTYDVITLEPMPPTLAGVNALYSLEFYRHAYDKLAPGGTIAQWVPFHLVTPAQGEALARTFIEVFPESFMWIREGGGFGGTGILVGRKPPGDVLDWPGLDREIARGLSPDEVRDGVWLPRAALARYASDGVVITDDNQYLAYGVETLLDNVVTQQGTELHQEMLAESHRRVRVAQGGR